MKKSMVIDRYGITRFFLGHREVTKKDFDASSHVKPPNYEKGECPLMRGDIGDFSRERDATTNEYGVRYYPQLARYPKDKKALYGHVNDAIEEGKRRGYTMERD